VAACRERAEVSLLARASTADAWAAVARVASDRDGAFALETIVKSSREYQLSLPPTSACAAADAGPFTITPTGSVRLVVGQLALHRGERTTLSGQVLPRSRGTRVTLQRATRGGWKRVARTRLDRRSRYRFTVRATWLGRRTFRVRWAGRPPQYGPAVSRRARLLSRRG
jgi:hypothetical protein